VRIDRSRWLLVPLVLALAADVAARPVPSPAAPMPPDLAGLAVAVTAAENRAVVFTNKRSAYFYTQTHRNTHPEHAGYRGYNIAGRQVFSDYLLSVNGIALDPATARAVVFPDALVREYPGGVTETLRLFDNRDLLQVELAGATGETRLALAGDRLRAAGEAQGLSWYVAGGETPPEPADVVAVRQVASRFLIAVGRTRDEVAALLDAAGRDAGGWQGARRARLERLIGGDHYLATDDPDLTRALRWLTLTTDALITHQRGAGIYAGLPWFNEYWGRDTFIALGGATLVTGQFTTAREILESFARFQDLDPRSQFYGRVPNIVRPESLDYHTTDGTPRFVIALRDYLRYSGDRALLAELYPNVVASIEGPLANWTDPSGYLVHRDNETWMDARRSSDLSAYSPRGTRANDIQALWYEQLRAGAEFASTLGATDDARRWSDAAARVRERFRRDFYDPAGQRLADRLTEGDVADYTLRPNALFALPLLGDARASAPVLRRTWQSLVFPWGVATLDPGDPNFHPYHLAAGRYPKDEAYHNGTVWPWLDGIAMQRMIEAGQVERAWPLFARMNEIALGRGVVGGLPETSDAYPHPGEPWPRLTGAFLQAWSNAEQLRIWYQYVLGVRPDLARGEILLAPRLPSAVGGVEFAVRVGDGVLEGRLDRRAGHRRYAYRLVRQAFGVTLDVEPYPIRTFQAAAGDTLRAQARDGGLEVRLVSSAGATKVAVRLAPSPERQRAAEALDAEFRGVHFASPRLGPAVATRAPAAARRPG